jgi:hypothetical protein
MHRDPPERRPLDPLGPRRFDRYGRPDPNGHYDRDGQRVRSVVNDVLEQPLRTGVVTPAHWAVAVLTLLVALGGLAYALMPSVEQGKSALHDLCDRSPNGAAPAEVVAHFGVGMLKPGCVGADCQPFDGLGGDRAQLACDGRRCELVFAVDNWSCTVEFGRKSHAALGVGRFAIDKNHADRLRGDL